MACYSPITAWRAEKPNANGKRPLVFRENGEEELEIPCGKCIGCRLEYSRQWAIRCVHEASLYDENCFVTLTYDDEHLPGDGSLNVRDWQLFAKRLRRRIEPAKFRFMMCGEYGTNPLDHDGVNHLGRPHYHAIIFGYDFPDKEAISEKDGKTLYRSQSLIDTWGKGEMSPVGDVTFESAAYVARYCVKKISGDSASDHYRKINPVTGETWPVKPEFLNMSRGGRDATGRNQGGIGTRWYRSYKDDLRKGFITLKGQKMALPKFYQNKMLIDEKEEYGFKLEQIKEEIREAMDPEEYTRERLETKHKLKKRQMTRLDLKR